MPDDPDDVDRPLDVSRLSLRELEDLDDSVLSHALRRISVSLDTESETMVQGFDSAIDEDVV